VYGLLGHSLDGKGVVYLQKVLQMHISMVIPQKGLACTIVINAGLSSKLASPLITLGPVAMLAVEGAENSRMVLLAISVLGGGKL
jgi:hypothetical protein